MNPISMNQVVLVTTLEADGVTPKYTPTRYSTTGLTPLAKSDWPGRTGPLVYLFRTAKGAYFFQRIRDEAPTVGKLDPCSVGEALEFWAKCKDDAATQPVAYASAFPNHPVVDA